MNPLFLGCGKEEQHTSEHVVEQNCSPHGSPKVERARKKGAKDKGLSRACLQGLTSSKQVMSLPRN
jgi:hypothetical protein